MPQFIKSNSCLIATDSSPAFSTGEKLGVYFLGLTQDFSFESSPARSQLAQLGSQDFGVDSINFSPDILTNISFLETQDFANNSLLGMVHRPSGEFHPIFREANDFSSNLYFFFSDLQCNDLIEQIKSSQSFSGVNLISVGNAYLTNASTSYSVGNLSSNNLGFVCSNIESRTLDGNFVKIPAINLESGDSSGAANLFLNPKQLDRIQTGMPIGYLRNVQSVLFSPTFENLQIPNQKLTSFQSSNIQSIDYSLSIDRENSYGFGSDYVFDRKIKFPIRGGLSVRGIVADYESGDFSSLMTGERKQNVEIFFRDEKDLYLSGLSNSEFVSLNETGHIVKNRWLQFGNCSLNKKSESISTNGLLEYSVDYSFAATENGGYSYKQGEPASIDDFYIRSSDLRKLVSFDGYGLIVDPFCRAYGNNCEVETILSKDGYIMCTADNFVYNGQNPVCYLKPTSFWNSIGLFESGFSAAYSATGGFSSSNSSSFVSYPAVVKSDGISNGKTLEYGTFYSGAFVSSGLSLSDRTGSLWYRVDRDIFQYSDNQVVNYNQNWFPARGTFSTPHINSARWNKYLISTVPDSVSLSIESGNSEAVEVFFRSGQNGWLSFNNRPVASTATNFFTNMLRLVPPTGVGSATGLSHKAVPTAPFGAAPYVTNFFEYYPIGYRGTGIISGSLTGVVRDCASGLFFDEGSSTFNEQGTLRWNSFNSGYGIPTGWNIYRYESGVSGPTKIGSSATMNYTDSTMYSASTYGFFVSSLINGYESWTGSCSIVGIESY